MLWFQAGTDPIGGDLWRMKMTKSSVKFWYHMHVSYEVAFIHLWHCTMTVLSDSFDMILLLVMFLHDDLVFGCCEVFVKDFMLLLFPYYYYYIYFLCFL